MEIDNEGHLWMGLYNVSLASFAGLARWDGQDFTFYNIENSDILSNRFSELKIAGDDLWIVHDRGLSQLKLSSVSSTQTPPAALPEPQFTLYPNPSAGPFHVKNETLAERRYEVYSINGELVLSETSDEEVWSSHLEPGVYIVKMITQEKELVEKLVVVE